MHMCAAEERYIDLTYGKYSDLSYVILVFHLG